MVEAARLTAVLVTDDQGATRALQAFGREFDSLADRVKAGFAFGAGLAGFQGALSAGRAAMEGFADAAIGMNSKLQQAQIGFETMLGSAQDAKVFLAQLADFAKTTPFEFKELIPQAQRLKAMGFEAEQVIPLLTDVGNASAAMGRGTEGINRITLALGQMNARTRVSAGEMNQLTEAGIPAWKILADAMGLSVAQVQKLSEQGKIASSTFINAFHEFAQNNWGDMMAKQAKTFEGAMSNVKDSLTAVAATAARPFFDAMTKVANVVADALNSDAVQVWAGVFQGATNAVLGGINRVIDGLAPLGKAIEYAFAELSEGDVAGALTLLEFGIEETFRGILTTIDSFTGGMATAGYNLIATFAQGIVDAGAELITAAVNFIAELIGSFLIGESPPPKGPLRSIDIGGRRVVEAYIGGMIEGAWQIEEVARIISDGFGEVSVAMGLEEGREALRAVAGDLNAVKAASEGIAGIIDSIDTQIAELNLEASEWKLIQEDIKIGYEDQLDPIDRQIEALKSVKDWQDEILDIQLKQEDVAIRKAEREARGDPRLRAELEGQKEALRFEEKQAQIDKQRADLAEQAKEKRNKKGEVTSAGKDISDELKILDLKQRQLEIEKQEAGLVNKGALAELAVRKAVNEDKKDGLDIARQEKQLARDLRVAQLEEQRSGIAEAMEEALAPGEEAIRQIQRRTDLLDIERERWQLLQDEADAYVEILEEALGEEGKKGRAGAKGRKAGAGRKAGGGKGKKGLDIPAAGGGLNIGRMEFDPSKLIKTEGLQEKGKELAGKLGEGIKAWISEHMGAVIGGGIGAVVGGIAFGPIGAIIGAGLGAAIGEKLSQSEEFQVALGKLDLALWHIGKDFREPGGTGDQIKAKLKEIGDEANKIVIGKDLDKAWKDLSTTITTQVMPAFREFISFLQGDGKGGVDGFAASLRGMGFTSIADSLRIVTGALQVGGAAMSVFGTIAHTVVEGATAAWQGLSDAATTMGGWIEDRFADMGQAVSNFLHDVEIFWHEGIVPAFNGIQDAATELKNWVGDRFDDLVTKAGEMKDGIGTAIDRIVDYYIDRFFREATQLRDTVKGAFEAIGTAATGMWRAISSAFDNILIKVRDVAGEVATQVNRMIDAINRIPGVNAPHIGGPAGWADGGIIPGAAGQPYIATVHGGEMVLNGAQQRQLFALLNGRSGGWTGQEPPVHVSVGLDNFGRFTKGVVDMEQGRSTDRTRTLSRGAGRV